ncbi:undecaprenyldiphospho-muramoylpentapeptide beta-N-acetylglucosaminyltransferase [Paenibacillus turpanensis]|uniref:undecaprenyldiphospho-muramoylpentapeptide beta-N-acetylglucosaminyltransferase n=1 Tax=Paenibacillus turpanensis TaxID=2689078 RepID=UPI00140C2D5A|nr:undecaprenyldiphospho-muramoylpentapeptide beta-N-acetylglucosaminyltransferase [Paenibacillus turpanensis]
MRVVLTGGGTGGHIYPALSVAKQCLVEEPQSELLYIGTTKGLEQDIVTKENLRFEAIEISGLRRNVWSLENIKTLIRFVKGVQRCKKLLREFKPDVVVGTGGYVCGPVMYAASKLGIPTLIHEQNVVPGLTNQFLSRYVSTVAVSFRGSELEFKRAKHVIYSGNPRASSVAEADARKGFETLGLPQGSKVVVVVGGSRGAKAVNDAMIGLKPFVGRMPNVHFVFITGKPYYDSTMEQLSAGEGKLPPHVHVLPYVHNMPEVLAATSLIISRAGATFIAEITALGIPSVLIPSPNVTNNHQEKNARILEEEGASVMVKENELSGEGLYTVIESIMTDPIRWEYMSKQAVRLGQPNSAKLLFKEMRRLIDVN